ALSCRTRPRMRSGMTAPCRRDSRRAMTETRTKTKTNIGMTGALDGLRVVELGTFITGPCAGMMLADLGADVIKIESPEGDPYRSYQGGHYSPHFQAYNRNKRSLALDLKKSADKEVLDQLVREADVF